MCVRGNDAANAEKTNVAGRASLHVPLSDTPPGQPLASKRQSPFHQRSPHGLSPSPFFYFIYVLFLSSCFPPTLIFILISSLFLFSELPSPLLWSTVVEDTSSHQPLYELMNADLSEEDKPAVRGSVWLPQVHVGFMCVRDVRGISSCRAWGPAAAVLWDNS